MFKRLFWISIGAALGVVGMTKAQSYIKANNPEAAEQLFGEGGTNSVLGTVQELFNEFNETRQAREAELNQEYADRLN